MPDGASLGDAAAGWHGALTALAAWATACAAQPPDAAAVATGARYLDQARAAAGGSGPGLRDVAAALCAELAALDPACGPLPAFGSAPEPGDAPRLAEIAGLLADAAGLRAQVALLMRSGDPALLDRAVEARRAFAAQAAAAASALHRMAAARDGAAPVRVAWTGPRPIEATVVLDEAAGGPDAATPLSFETGTLVGGRYEIRDVIGAGSYGTVLEAHDTSINRLVALKVIQLPPVQDAQSAELLATFRREAQAAGLLSHPGIVTVYDFGQEAGFAWIVMQLVIGETLEAVLERHEPIGPGEAVRVALELLDALTLAHSYGIVHRDIKAANVLLAMSEKEGLGRVMLADFGVAMLGNRGMGRAGQLVGTLSTMAPEQVRGDAVDHRADLWAVGVVFYQMLTGAAPFAGEPAAMMRGILMDDPVPPSARVPGLPRGLDAVVARALAKQPEARFATGTDMVQAIRMALV